MPIANLFADLPCPATGEAFETLLRHRNLVIERIASSATPEPGIYDQAQDEWVLLVQGQATLEVGRRDPDPGARRPPLHPRPHPASGPDHLRGTALPMARRPPAPRRARRLSRTAGPAGILG